MKHPHVLILLLAICTATNAQTKTVTAPSEPGPLYWRHSAEFQVTPFASYFFYVPPDPQHRYSTDEGPYEFYLPMPGVNIGGRYTYRPFNFFGVSAGLNVGFLTGYYRHTAYATANEKYVDYKDLSYMCYLTMPVQFHFYKQMKRSTFEFSTGPDFNFAIVAGSNSIQYNSTGEKVYQDKYKMTGLYPFLGWNVTLGGELDISSKVKLFLGPQFNFHYIADYNAQANRDSRTWGQSYPVSLGFKMGFR